MLPILTREDFEFTQDRDMPTYATELMATIENGWAAVVVHTLLGVILLPLEGR
jgi:hypothetical protein